MFKIDEEKITTFGKATASSLKVFKVFQRKPMLTVSEITKNTGLTKGTVINSLKRLIGQDIIINQSEKKWGQVYSYQRYTRLLSKNSDPL